MQINSNIPDTEPVSIPDIDTEELIKIIKTSLKRRFHGYEPYKKQLEFHNSMASTRVLSGANRVGKSYSASFETACHATGFYPPWFKGKRLTPVYDENLGMTVLLGLVIGKDATSVRDTLQKTLIGSEALNWNDGIIDKSLIDLDNMIKKRSISGGAIEQITIKRIDGGITILKFRSYDQGRERLQGFPLDFAHMDEEPTEKGKDSSGTGIYGEISARLLDRKQYGNGIKYMSFTPLSGLTPLVQQIWKQSEEGESKGVLLVIMSVEDCPHLDLEECRQEYQFLSEHEQNARLYGIPSGGQSRVYMQDKSEIQKYPPVHPIPEHWRQLIGIDFGRGTHPFAITWMCEDPDDKIKYIYKTEKRTGLSSFGLVDLIKNATPYGLNIPVAYPHDLNKSVGTPDPDNPNKYESYSFVKEYKRQGLKVLKTFAHTMQGDRASIRVEDGLEVMRREFHQGRLKVLPTCTDFFDEYDLYSYDESGNIKKVKDDLVDSARYCNVMFDKYAKSVQKMKIDDGNTTSIVKYNS